ncbi:hypothetical protein ACKXF4_06630 [Faecalibacterium prausnitzii]|uniref:hypothetical protein n=1 Tax=Faecalibacterium prausnitzii TaxID=853 RepID=UPI003AAC8E99
MKKISRGSFDRYGRCECSGAVYRLRRFLLHGKLRGILSWLHPAKLATSSEAVPDR